MLDKLCEPHHLLLIITALILALIALGGGKGLGTLLGPLLKQLGGGKGASVTVNMGDEMARRNEAIKGLVSHEAARPANPICEDCTEHALVKDFIVQSTKDKSDIYRKVNRANIKLAKIELMVEMLCKARGLQIDFSKVDMHLDEGAEG